MRSMDSRPGRWSTCRNPRLRARVREGARRLLPCTQSRRDRRRRRSGIFSRSCRWRLRFARLNAADLYALDDLRHTLFQLVAERTIIRGVAAVRIGDIAESGEFVEAHDLCALVREELTDVVAVTEIGR